MSDTGRVIANIIQMDESVIKLREAAATVEQATAAVERENGYLTPDRYQSPAAEVYRANYANATSKLLSTKDNLYTFSKNLETSREAIAQAAGVTNQQIFDQKLRISELRDDIGESESLIDGYERDISDAKLNISNLENQKGSTAAMGIGDVLSIGAGVGGLFVAGVATGGLAWVGAGVAAAGFGSALFSGGERIIDIGHIDNEIQTEIDNIAELEQLIADEQQKIDSYQEQLFDLGVEVEGYEPPVGIYYVPEDPDSPNISRIAVA